MESPYFAYKVRDNHSILIKYGWRNHLILNKWYLDDSTNEAEWDMIHEWFDGLPIESKKKLKEELQFLESVERPRVIAAIAEARDKGDLSENAEYDAAKEEQGILESKISLIKSKIVDARIIDETDINTDEVQILTKVRVLNLKTNQEKVYQLVTEGEANVAEGKLATTTPIAKGLLGKKVGDIAEVVVPAGKLQFKVLEISI